MNETISTILRRRSVRVYRPDPVGQTELAEMLEAGRYAPSAMNQQPWHFTAIRNPELLRKLEENCRSAFLESNVEALREVARQEGFSVFYKAPLMVIISGDPGALAAQYDCTLAMENMMLAATSLGMGSCWTHALMMFHATEKGKSIFSEIGLRFPEGHQPYAAAVFGWPAEPYPEAPPKKADCSTIID
ncbi:MAG: nitroreductase family protein [Chlorobi bacterium]|nr:nitroreductase family protein [Chlorobiota bacterium]